MSKKETPDQEFEQRPGDHEGTEQADPGETVEVALEEAESLTTLLEDARSKADEHWNELLRARAEIENQRRRFERELENAHKFALEKFSGELLAVADSLELAVNAANQEGASVEGLRDGSELTLKMLLQVLEKHGVRQVDPAGEKFDPQHHEAMSMQPSAEAEPNSVLFVVQKGYQLNERLIRPARVVVAKAPEGA